MHLTIARVAVQKWMETNLMNETDRNIYLILKKLGVPCKIMGYEFIKSALLIMVRTDRIPSITRELYPQIASEFGVSATNVERNIRYAIQRTIDRINPKDAKEILGTWDINKDTPTNKQFLSAVLEYLRYNNMRLTV